jgi:hypothetical protein
MFSSVPVCTPTLSLAEIQIISTGSEENWDIIAINYFAGGPCVKQASLLVAGEWVTLQYRIREEPGSDLGPATLE